jgi:predicted DNA-binding protein (MmcQ/YjbR family)
MSHGAFGRGAGKGEVGMARNDSVLRKLREICLSLPDTKETLTWGTPHFRVADKIFCGCGEERGRPSIGFKLEMDHADAVIQDPRFRRAPYVGHKGWVSMDPTGTLDWEEVRALVLESYRLIAPKKTLRKLEGATRPAPSRRAARTATSRRSSGKGRAHRRPR